MGKWVAALGCAGVKKSSCSSKANGVLGMGIYDGGARLRTLGGSTSCRLFFEGCLPMSMNLGGPALAGFGLGAADFDSWKSTV